LIRVSGYTKQNGAVDPMSHAWCASKIDNQWYIFDPTWVLALNNGFVNAFDDRYFKANLAK
jgi:transglutaminase/protease-like cytokinesis protein 3